MTLDVSVICLIQWPCRDWLQECRLFGLATLYRIT
jgi:hypothetical protein